VGKNFANILRVRLRKSCQLGILVRYLSHSLAQEEFLRTSMAAKVSAGYSCMDRGQHRPMSQIAAADEIAN
jgi:hypothetical protein